jgi:hypothetical protein
MTNGASNQIKVTIKTTIDQSWDWSGTTDNTVRTVLDKATEHFGVKLAPGDIAQLVRVPDYKPLGMDSTLATEGVNDGATLLLEVGPPMTDEVVDCIWRYLVLVAVGALFFLVAVWPKTVTNNPGNITSYNYTRPFFGLASEPHANPELYLLLVVVCSAIIGATVQALASLVQHKSASDLAARWKGWYFSRPPLAIGLALMIYFLVRGGLLSLSTVSLGADPTHINVFAVAALSAITGMFTDEASKRIGKVVDTLFGEEEGPGTSATTPGNPFTIKLAVSPQSGAVSFAPSCSFNCTGGQKPVRVMMDYDDGTPKVDVTNRTGADSSHSYTKPGTYKIKITATDGSGSIASDSKEITVSRRVRHRPLRKR